MCRKNTVELQSLSFRYQGERNLLDRISFCLREGDVMTLLGPNGSGKSTLLSCIMGFLDTYEGEIYICEKNAKRYSSKDIAAQVAYVPQLHELAFDYLVKDFVVMGRNAHLGYFEQPGKQDYALVDRYLNLLGISSFAERNIRELSGGEKQLVYIARALVQEPKIIILDEPTSALDYGNSIKIIDIINQLKNMGYTILMTSHDPNHPLAIGGYVAILYRDHTFQFGTAEELLNSETLTELYGTKIEIIDLETAGKKVCVNV